MCSGRGSRSVLGQIVGDREPRRLVDDKRVRVGAYAGIIVERHQRDAIERHGGRVGMRAARVAPNFASASAPTLCKSRGA